MRKSRIVLFLTILVSIILLILLLVHNVAKKSPAEILLNDAGVFMQPPPKEYGNQFGEKIVNMLLTKEDIHKITLPNNRMIPTIATLFNYGERGKTLSYSKNLDLNTGSMMVITIDRPDSIKLRHKIEIGTDMRNWELIKQEKNLSDNTGFKRIYVLVQKRGEQGRMAGLVYYEGVIVEIEIEGYIDDNTIKSLEEVTWLVADRIGEVYDNYIKQISEGYLFKDDPVLTRPDLPDSDE